jgi:hypothetical protein
VDWVVTQDQRCEIRSNVSLLEKIERYLAAHFYQVADPGYKSLSKGGATGQFRGNDGLIFTSTVFGQQACAMDVTGALAKRSKETEEGSRHVMQMQWGGSNQQDRTIRNYGGNYGSRMG